MNLGRSQRLIPARHRLALSTLLSVLVGAVLFSATSQAVDPPAATSTGAPVAAVPAPLSKNFAIFRTPSEAVPPEIAEGVEKINAITPPKAGPFAGSQGFNVALGQEVVLPGKHAPLWAIPGRDQVMLFDQPRNGHFGASGTTIARAVKRGVVFWSGVPKTHKPHLMRVRGIVPDGVTSVRLSKAVVAPVLDNAFTRKVDQARLFENFVLSRQPLAEIPSNRDTAGERSAP